MYCPWTSVYCSFRPSGVWNKCYIWKISVSVQCQMAVTRIHRFEVTQHNTIFCSFSFQLIHLEPHNKLTVPQAVNSLTDEQTTNQVKKTPKLRQVIDNNQVLLYSNLHITWQINCHAILTWKCPSTISPL